MPIITFDKVPDELTKVFGDPLNPTVPTAYVGSSYVEDGFTVSIPSTGLAAGLLEYFPLLSGNYYITGENLFSSAFNPLSPITLTRGGNYFGVQSIDLDALVAGSFEEVVSTGVDANGNSHTQSFSTDGARGLETFVFSSEFQSNLVSLSWMGFEFLDPLHLIPLGLGSHLPLADNIDLINLSPDTTLTDFPFGRSGTTATFTFSSDDPGAHFQYKLDNATNWTTVAASTVTLTGLTNGQHEFQVAAVSADGIVDPTPAEYTWIVDTSIHETLQHSTLTVLVDAIANQYQSVTVSIDHTAPVQAQYDLASHEWTATVAGLSDGTHTFAVQTTDANGNINPLNFQDTVTVDTDLPTSTIAQTLENDTGASHTDLITSDGNVTVTGTASEAVKSVEIWNAVSNTEVGTATIAGDNISWSFKYNLPEGSYQLYAKVTDLSDNVGQTVTEPIIVVDQTAPIPVMLNAVFDPASDLTTLSGISKANSSVDVYEGTKLIGTATADVNGKWSLQANVTGSTIHSYTEKATDLAGNAGNSAGVTLYTPAANETLTGGNGNDVLIGRPNDTLTGGAGSDTFVFNPGSGKETVTDFNQSQHDVIEFAGVFAGGTHITSIGQLVINQSGGNTVIHAGADAVTLVGFTGTLTAHDFVFA
jgi:Ca2+-binding RTX toxin-like protein